MVDHDVVRFHVAVHDAARVAKVEGLEEFKDVVPDVVVGQARVEDFEVGVVDVFKHQTRRLALRAIVVVGGFPNRELKLRAGVRSLCSPGDP